jgi:hypothetical protein
MMMKLEYSPNIAWDSTVSAVGTPWSAASGAMVSTLHTNATLPQ